MQVSTIMTMRGMIKHGGENLLYLLLYSVKRCIDLRVNVITVRISKLKRTNIMV